jgi:hypothetical protein
MLRLATVVLVGIVIASPAHADDRVAMLSKQLASSSSEKERVAAVIALARVNDRTTMKPLVAALHDPSSQVRALAATALGQLGHQAALPSLRTCANDDADEDVRRRARIAATAVAKANHIPDDQPAIAASDELAAHTAGRPGFGHQPRAVENRPDVCVLINGANDDSPGKADKKTRETHAAILRQVLGDSFRAAPQVTTTPADAQRWGLDPRHIDVSVVKLETSTGGAYVEVEAQLRVAITDGKGKMLSFLSGGAKVQVPRGKFNTAYLPNLRREALENAMRGMFDKLLAHLRGNTSS